MSLLRDVAIEFVTDYKNKISQHGIVNETLNCILINAYTHVINRLNVIMRNKLDEHWTNPGHYNESGKATVIQIGRVIKDNMISKLQNNEYYNISSDHVKTILDDGINMIKINLQNKHALCTPIKIGQPYVPGVATDDVIKAAETLFGIKNGLPSNAGGTLNRKKIYILGRTRNIRVKDRKKYVMYKNELIPLSEAKKLDKKSKPRRT